MQDPSAGSLGEVLLTVQVLEPQKANKCLPRDAPAGPWQRLGPRKE